MNTGEIDPTFSSSSREYTFSCLKTATWAQYYICIIIMTMIITFSITEVLSWYCSLCNIYTSEMRQTVSKKLYFFWGKVKEFCGTETRSSMFWVRNYEEKVSGRHSNMWRNRISRDMKYIWKNLTVSAYCKCWYRH